MRVYLLSYSTIIPIALHHFHTFKLHDNTYVQIAWRSPFHSQIEILIPGLPGLVLCFLNNCI
jgi:hypothetical protein